MNRGAITGLSLVVLGAAFAVACGAFGSDTNEATAPATDAGTTVDGVAPPAAPDAGTDAPDAGPTCEAIVAESFDNGDLPKGFAHSSGNDGDAGISSAQHVSGASSLGATLTLTSGGKTNGHATIERQLMLGGPLGDRSLVLDAWVYVETNTDAYAELGCTVELRNAAGDATRIMFAKSTDGSLNGTLEDPDGGTKGEQLVPSYKPGWHELHLVARNAVPAVAEARWDLDDGGGAATATTNAPESADRVLLVCGIDYASLKTATTTTVNVWIDDLRVQLCPGP